MTLPTIHPSVKFVVIIGTNYYRIDAIISVCQKQGRKGIILPERGLHPVYQIEFFEECMQEMRSKPEQGYFITTHSPYILTHIDLMLYAGQLAELGYDKKAVAKIVPEHLWIKQGEVAAFDCNDGVCTDIIDIETREDGNVYHSINTSSIDTASQEHLNQYSQLVFLQHKPESE
jgi:hypothetical protein